MDSLAPGERTHTRKPPVSPKPWGLLALLLVALIILSVVSLGIGAVPIPGGQVVRALLERGEESASFIIWEYRLPRIVLAWLVGASLGMSGAVIQGVVRNPLAAPDVMGVTGGAGLAAAILLLAVPKAHHVAVPLAAFGGGMAAATLVYLLAYRKGVSPTRLALVGVAVSAVCNSGLRFLVTKFSVEVNVALTWLAGSLWGRGWAEVQGVLPWVVLMSLVIYVYARRLDVLGLGDEVAAGLGEPVERTRLVALLAAVALASASVAVSGTISFIGLVAPHIARRLVGGTHQFALLASALMGALLLLLSDAAGRALIPPLEIPAGLFTSIVGAPYFLYLLRRVKV